MVDEERAAGLAGGPDAHRPPVGGVELAADEWVVLQSYRKVRSAGAGMLVIEFTGHKCTKFEVKHAGDVRLLNSLLATIPLRD